MPEYIISFRTEGDGDYRCSSCNDVLLGEYLVICEEGDDEGLSWRGFCYTCDRELEDETEYDLYHDYEPCELV